MSMETVRATYEIETALDLEKVAATIANEQSSGTFVKVARETAQLRERYAARVVGITELEPSGRPPLPGASGDWSRARRARVEVDFPLHNMGPSIPNLLAAVAGNLFDLREVGALRLVDLDLPHAFAERYPGPQFGVRGTRELVGRPEGALLGTIVKPSIGLSVTDLADLVSELAEAGIDFIKDDELNGNPPDAPLEARVAAVMPVLKRYADRHGRMPMYAFNITDDISRLEANHDLVRDAGGTAVMVCVVTLGLAGVEHLRRRCELPIHGHRTMFGALSRSPQLGIDFLAFQRLARLCGVDHLHTNGIHNKFYESDEQVLRSIAAVREPLFGGYETLPVLSSGQSAALAHETYAAVGTTDILVMAGGGIHGHPMGSAAGVTSMREAWDAAVRGEPLLDRAARVPELAAALDLFAGRAPGAAQS
ncbi:MAG TPA: RuBisCO large subunit C-terminal-like domain-containing protein [Propionibacteriaceae bacterium]|nr:RuBisCO large subunit C-terminal-like domain-containing protein [Propionibacteriaceae bacterium]